MYKRTLLVVSSFLLISIYFPGYGKAGKMEINSVSNFEKKNDIKLKPFRVLVVIGDQWTCPLSYNIDRTSVNGTDFLDVINMLKIWGVPFDILRLDEQKLQINRFLDGIAEPNYGSIIWMADPGKLEGFSANYETLWQAVTEYGISMIALFDHIKTDRVADLIGLDYQHVKRIKLGNDTDNFTITGKHFITSDLIDANLNDQSPVNKTRTPGANYVTSFTDVKIDEQDSINLVICTASDSVKVLGSIGQIPQFVVNDLNDDAKVVWIGGGRDWFRKYPVMRNIFRRALVYSLGYGVFNDTFDNGFIFIMDDIGTSENAYSLKWHYPTPSKETLIKYLIEPLEKYGFMMVQNVTPGYANPETRMIEVPWTVEPFEDIFGNWQDYGSSKEGLDEGLRRGVFEIQPHRAWTHMNWDLDSYPGPWWDGPIDGEMALTSWYSEVYDSRRGNIPVPPNDLLFIYKTGIDAIKKQFGVAPLTASVRPEYDNGRIAAIAGLSVGRNVYVGFDYTIEFNMMMPEYFICHDLDLTLQTGYPADQHMSNFSALSKLTTEQLMSSKIAGGRLINLIDNLDWIESRKDKYWMGYNETSAYLHTKISNTGKNGIEFYYDDHYCKYFENNHSSWTLELSDNFRDSLGRNAFVSINGKKMITELTPKQIIEIPPGLGIHTIEFNRD